MLPSDLAHQLTCWTPANLQRSYFFTGTLASQLLLRNHSNPNQLPNALHSLGFLYKPPEITHLKDKMQKSKALRTCLQKKKGPNLKHEHPEISLNDLEPHYQMLQHKLLRALLKNRRSVFMAILLLEECK